MASLNSTDASPDLQRGPVLLAISVSTTAFAFASCFVRFCIRARSDTKFGWDDYSIVVAMVVGLVGTILTIVESISTQIPVKALRFAILSQPWIMMGAAMAKISICFFFLRLVGKQQPWNILLAVQIAVLSIINTISTLTTNLQCRPLEKLWNPIVEGTCWDPTVQQNIGYTQGAFTVFTDFFLTLFPILIIRDMNVRKSMRWPFYILASLSFFAGFCAIIRTYELSITTGQKSYTADHFTFAVLSTLEQNLGVLAANTLCLCPLLNRNKKITDDIEMRVRSDDEIIDEGLFIIEGPRRSSVDTIDREKYLVSTKVAGMWGIGAAPNKQVDEDGRAPSKSSSIKRKEVGSSSKRPKEDVVGKYWQDDAPLPWGIIKTVRVEVVNEAISDVQKQNKSRRDSVPSIPVRNQTAGNAITDGLKNIGGNLRSLVGSIRGHQEEPHRHRNQGATGRQDGEQDWETILRGGPA